MEKFNIKKSLLGLTLLILFACGSETEDKIISSPSTNNFIAYDKLATAPLNTFTTIDLSTQLDGEQVKINSIYSDTPEKCYAQVKDSLTVDIEIYELGRCDYTFVAEDKFGAKKQAQLIVISSKANDAALPTITFNTEIEQNNNQINLESYLGADILDNYSLIENDITIQSELGAEPIVLDYSNLNNLSIKFNSPTTIGWHRIYYVLNNDANQESKIGEILITVSNELNPQPTITNSHYFYLSKTAIIGEEFEVDLSEIACHEIKGFEQICLEITDPNFDATHAKSPPFKGWQISNVQSLDDSIIKVSDPEDSENTRFKITPHTEGFHNVSYVVSNHFGASNSGIITVFASKEKIHFESTALTLENDPIDWIGWIENFLPGAVTYVEAMDYGNNTYQFDDVGTVDANCNVTTEKNLIAVWTMADAKAFCSFNADGLPTQSNFESYIKDMHIKSWPRGQSYFIKDGDDTKLYTLPELGSTKGVVTELQGGEIGYASCFCSNGWGSAPSKYCNVVINEDQNECVKNSN